jgi:hypothetical protein
MEIEKNNYINNKDSNNINNEYINICIKSLTEYIKYNKNKYNTNDLAQITNILYNIQNTNIQFELLPNHFSKNELIYILYCINTCIFVEKIYDINHLYVQNKMLFWLI